MEAQADDLIGRFLLSVQPAGALSAYRTLAGLNYPIADKHSLDLQLEESEPKNGEA